MRHALIRKPSAAMVVAVIALVVAASGTAVAASKLVKGDQLIAKHSLSGNRLRNRTVTGKQLKLSSLGTVPSAENAVNATNATNATNASNASTVGGDAPSAFDASSNWTRTGLVGIDEGQSATLAAFGPFTITMKCLDTGGEPEVQLFVTSTAPGSTALGTALPSASPFFDDGPDTAFDEFDDTSTFVSPSAAYFGDIMTAINSPASTHLCTAMALVSKS